jgi:ketosteroid isomerase-like protein
VAEHPHAVSGQAVWDALADGDPGPAFEQLADDVIIDNGPGAAPWAHVEGKAALGTMMLEFVAEFRDDWKQQGQVVYADDEVAISLVRETGTAKSGDRFDNRAIWISRYGEGGTVNRIWTVDLAHEELERFWQRNPVRAPD